MREAPINRRRAVPNVSSMGRALPNVMSGQWPASPRMTLTTRAARRRSMLRTWSWTRRSRPSRFSRGATSTSVRRESARCPQAPVRAVCTGAMGTARNPFRP
jgi:hypothetical protein